MPNGSSRTTNITIGVIVDQSTVKASSSTLRGFWGEAARIQSGAFRDLAKQFAGSDKTNFDAHKLALSNLLALDREYYASTARLRQQDEKDRERSARASAALTLRISAEIEQKTRQQRASFGVRENSTGSGSGRTTQSSPSNSTGAASIDGATQSAITGLSALDRQLKAGVVERGEYLRQVLAMAQREGVSEEQLLKLYTRARTVRLQISNEEAAARERETQRVQRAAQAEVRAVDSEIAADRRAAGERIAEEKRVGAIWDEEAKKAKVSADKIVAAYHEETEAAKKAAGGASAGGHAGPHPLSGDDIANAIAASQIFATIKDQLMAGIEAVSKFDDAVNEGDATFGEYSGHVKDWAKTTSDAIGLSETAAISAASKFGLLLTDMGLTTGSATVMSARMVQLAADLGSFTHIGTEKALDAIYAGLNGNVRGLKALGIAITPAMLKQEALNEGLIASKKEALDPATRAQAAYALILRQSERATGDFSKRSDQLRNSQSKMAAELENAQKKLGEQVEPEYIKLLETLTNLLKKLQESPSDIAKFSGALLATVGSGGALGLFVGKLWEISKTIKALGLVVPGGVGLAGSTAPLSVGSAAVQGLGGGILALPAVEGALWAKAIVDQNDVTNQNAINDAALPPYIDTAGRISDLADKNRQIQHRIQRLQSPAHEKAIREAGGWGDTADAMEARFKANADDIAALGKELSDNEQTVARLRKVYDTQYAQALAAMRKDNKAHDYKHNTGDPKITPKKQAPPDPNAEEEARKAAADAASARETIAKAQKEELQRNLEALKERFKSGKGDDSMVGTITKLAIQLRDAEIREARAAFSRETAGDPKHTLDASARLATSMKSAGNGLTTFQKDTLPSLVVERNRTIDAATMKLIEERLKNYSVNDSESQRHNVLSDVYGMRMRLRTSEAQQQALDRVTEARQKVGEEILRSEEKYHETVDANRKIAEELTERQQQATLDLLNAQLDEVRDLPARKALREQIATAQGAMADAARKAAYDAITRESAQVAARQHGKLTPEQEAGFQGRLDIADQVRDTAVGQVGIGRDTGNRQDTQADFARQAREARERAEFARTPGEKADLVLTAGMHEIQAAGPISDAERQTLMLKNQREEFGLRADQNFEDAGKQLLQAAQTGDRGALSNAFDMASGARDHYAMDDSQVAEMIQREVKMLLGAAELPGSKLTDGDGRAMLRDRMKNLEGEANRLGDVDLMLRIDADVKTLDEKLKSSAEKMREEFRAAIISSISSGVDTFSSTLLDILAHQALGRRDRYARGQSGGRMLHEAGENFVRSQATGLEKTAAQHVGKLVNDNLQDLFKPKRDAQGNVVGPSSINRVMGDLKGGRIGEDLEASARKVAAYLHIGGQDAGKEIAEGAGVLFTAAGALGAAFGKGAGGKHRYGGLIGSVIGGIAGSFIGGPGGGWKVGSALGGQVGGMLGFAEGGVPPVGKFVMVGERGPEIARFDNPARIYSHSDSRAMLSGGGGETHNHTHYHTNNAPFVQMDVGTIHDRANARMITESVKDSIVDNLDGFIRRM